MYPVLVSDRAGGAVIVWTDLRGADFDVYAQRVSPDAQLLGDNVTIIAEPTSKTGTAVAYDPGNNRYFAAWQYQGGDPGSPGFNHAFGGLVSATGGLLQDAFDVSNGGLEATLVFNTIASEYFLEARNFAGGGIPGIRGRHDLSDAALLEHWVPDIAERDVYVCGPEPWTDLVARDLAALGHPRGNLHLESFAW